MVMIVAHHFAVHGGFVLNYHSLSLNQCWVQFLLMGGKIGVNIFILISGYFLIDSKKFNISKILKFIMQLLTYSLLTFAIGMLLHIQPFNFKQLIRHCLPITFRLWWFASTYIVLYIISPYLNKFLNSLKRKEYKYYLLLCTFMWCLIPTLTSRSFESNNLIWFIYLYSLAGYIKKYYKSKNGYKTLFRCFISTLVWIILTFLSTLIFDVVALKVSFISKYTTYFFGMQKLPILMISASLFLGFLHMNMENNKIINSIASTTFGIYLIHDSYFGRNIIWLRLFKNSSFLNSNWLIPYSLFAIFTVFITCSFIEFLRITVIEKHCTKIIHKLASKIDNLILRIQHSKILEKI